MERRDEEMLRNFKVQFKFLDPVSAKTTWKGVAEEIGEVAYKQGMCKIN